MKKKRKAEDQKERQKIEKNIPRPLDTGTGKSRARFVHPRIQTSVYPFLFRICLTTHRRRKPKLFHIQRYLKFPGKQAQPPKPRKKACSGIGER
jgi:hypothetical protein